MCLGSLLMPCTSVEWWKALFSGRKWSFCNALPNTNSTSRWIIPFSRQQHMNAIDIQLNDYSSALKQWPEFVGLFNPRRDQQLISTSVQKEDEAVTSAFDRMWNDVNLRVSVPLKSTQMSVSLATGGTRTKGFWTKANWFTKYLDFCLEKLESSYLGKLGILVLSWIFNTQ